MKIIAFYLPQYHAIPENDEWWGKGFTEWTNVKKAVPVIKGQVQPKVPLNNNYYCLLDDDVKMWQVKMAKEAGVYGFCYYHYWFNGKMLLEKPAEQMLANKKVDMPFCFSWANEPWSRSWNGDSKNVIMEQRYGGEKDWVKHFEYLLPFFMDDRYIKENEKPMFVIYKPDIMTKCYEMMECWDRLAKSAGFPGMYFGFQFPSAFRNRENEEKFDFGIEFEPLYSRTASQDFLNISTVRGKLGLMCKHPLLFMKISSDKLKNKYLNKPVVYNYSKECEKMVHRSPYFKNSVPGMYTGWDKTPRNGSRAMIYTGSTPDRFYHYLSKQVERAQNLYGTEYLFITAWNEWGEGAYLEPDQQFGYGYLDAIRKVL